MISRYLTPAEKGTAIELISSYLIPAAGVLLFLILLAGGVVTVVVRRKRLATRPGGLASLHDAVAGRLVDGALGDLAGELSRHGRTAPGIVLVTVDAESIRLRLSSPCAEPPTPWLASANDTIWSRLIVGIRPSTPAVPSSHGITGLMTVSRADGVATLIDFSEANGLVGVDGDRLDLLATADRWVEDFSRNPWSRGLPILLVGRDEIPVDGTVSAVTSDELVQAVARGGSGLAFVDEPLPSPVGDRLRRALEFPGCRWAVVVLTGTDVARWRFTVGPDGSVTSDVFPSGAPTDALVGAEDLR